MRRFILLTVLGLGATSLTCSPASAVDATAPPGHAHCEAWLGYTKDLHGGRTGSVVLDAPGCPNALRTGTEYSESANDVDPQLTIEVWASSYRMSTGNFVPGATSGSAGAWVEMSDVRPDVLYMYSPRIPFGTGADLAAVKSQVTFDCFGTDFLGVSAWSTVGAATAPTRVLLPDGQTLVETNKTIRRPVVDANGLTGEEVVQQAIVYTYLPTGAQRVIGESRLVYYGNPCDSWVV